MEKLIDISSYPVVDVLDLLLQDKSTKKNIIWATDTYEEFGEGFTDKVQMLANVLLLRPDIIQSRIQKSLEAQAQRTRKKAEVFTPAWLCNRMNNHCDEDWFGRSSVFNTEKEDHTWTVTDGRIDFPKRKKWQHYVDSRRLEITCGEAPYLVSRYDVSNGELIVPLVRRIGMLDRKLRIVNENTDTYEEWLKWTIRAFEASYGYEYQGDNVLIARINLLLTFIEYYEERWGRSPDDRLLEQVANKIAWNIWQMDGLKDTVPLGKPHDEFRQMTLFDMLGVEDERKDVLQAVSVRVFNWRRNASLTFLDTKEIYAMGKKLFDYVIGNPPYQENVENEGDRANPIYNKFMDAAYSVADCVELIHPARFLFNAGQTPKVWNNKMLNDEHFTVLYYEPDASKVFANTEIKGGVAITLRHDKRIYGAIGVFTSYSELTKILGKVSIVAGSHPRLDSIIASQGLFHFSNSFFAQHPYATSVMGKGTGSKIVSSVMEKLPEIFMDNPLSDSDIRFMGRIQNQRSYKYINRNFIEDNPYLDKFKLFVPEANGSGKFGEALASPIVGYPGEGSADTYLSAGRFDTEVEPKNLERYMKTKFFRALLGVKKVTQHCPPHVWEMIPLQNFTTSSDIDWSKSIREIDLQLYRKYDLNEKEIEFIETHVKEME